MTRDPPEEKVNKELYICTGEREPPLLEVIIEIFTLFFFHIINIYTIQMWVHSERLVNKKLCSATHGRTVRGS